MFFLKPSSPCHSIPVEDGWMDGCVHHKDPLVPRARLLPALQCRRTNLESQVDVSTEPALTQLG